MVSDFNISFILHSFVVKNGDDPGITSGFAFLFSKLLTFSLFPSNPGGLARKNSEHCEEIVPFVVTCWHICDEREYSGKRCFWYAFVWCKVLEHAYRPESVEGHQCNNVCSI